MKSDDSIHRLPQPIIDRLREVIARVRRVQWVRGILVTAATGLGSLLVVMAADAAFSLEWLPLRMAASLAALGLTGWVAWSYGLRPLSRRISLTHVARWLESNHPELQERISTAVELMDERHGPPDEGSRELLEEVVKAAVADAAQLDPAQDLGPQRTRLAKRWAMGAAAAMTAVLAVWPHHAPLLLVRALAPLADVGNAWANRLRVITDSQVLATGEPLAVEVAVQGQAARVELRMTGPTGRLLVETLSPDNGVTVQPGETGFALRLPSVEESFTGTIVSGKAVSAGFTITIVPRPETGDLTLTYHFPEYTGRQDEVRTGASGDISALTGTSVSVSAPLNRPVAKAEILIGETPVSEVKLEGDPAHPVLTWNTVLTDGLDTQWQALLTDSDGIQNRPVKLPIRALKDEAPQVTIESPAEFEMELRPGERLPLTYVAREDIGFSAVKLRVRVEGRDDFFLTQNLLPEKVSGADGEWHGAAELNLLRAPVTDGQEFRLAVVVADNLPPGLKGPQEAESEEILIRVRRGAKSLIEQVFLAQHEELRQRMNQVKDQLQDARGRLNDKPDRLREDQKLSENVMKDLDHSTSALEEAQKMLQELTDRMQQTAFAKQTPDLAQIAQNMVKPALESTKEIPLTDKQDARSAMAQSAKDQLEMALQKLEEQKRQLDGNREDVRQVAQLSDIAAQQMVLAQQAQESLNPQASPDGEADSRVAATDPPGEASAGNSPPPSDLPQSASPPTNPAQSADPRTAAAAPSPGPTTEEQKKWLEEQKRVAQRARELTQENRNQNPEERRDQLKQAGENAMTLSATAKELAGKEAAIGDRITAAATAADRKSAAADQEALAVEASLLQARARAFQEQSSRQIDQNSGTREAAFQTMANLEQAVNEAQASGRDLAEAVKDSAQALAADPATGEPTHSEALPQTDNSAANANVPATAPGSVRETDGILQAAAAATAPAGPPSGKATQISGIPNPGEAPAMASRQALDAASVSLDALGGQLHLLAGVVEDHNQSLSAGAEQASQAADQAGQTQQEGGAPSMNQGAGSAQQAADNLMLAAATAMQARSIPDKASNPQTSGQRAEANGQNAKPNDSGKPGRDGGDILQADTATGALPPELAKLGLTESDWAKLKGVLAGVNSAESAQVPAEYRDLVKAYFGALAKGGKPQ